MDVTVEHLNQFKDALKQESLRLTNQRIAILEDLLGSEEHRECDDIYLSLRKKQVPVSRATIYRTLDILEQVGFVRKLDIGDGRFRYENKLAQAHHDHMICLKCGKIVEFVDHVIERRQDQIASEKGFNLLKHSHQLFGLCRSCQGPASSED
jgi:Fur family ferric uptake transcriptional regulator